LRQCGDLIRVAECLRPEVGEHGAGKVQPLEHGLRQLLHRLSKLIEVAIYSLAASVHGLEICLVGARGSGPA